MRAARAIMAVALAACLSASACTAGSRSAARSTSTSAPRSAAGPVAPAASNTAASNSAAPGTASGASGWPFAVPHFDHVVVVVEENRGYGDVIGSAEAPYLNSLGRSGVVLAQSFAITHPSEPNYLALFSGTTHGLEDDSCPHSYDRNNLGAELRAAGQTFIGYSEDLPSAGYTGCTSGGYARKHAPWVDFPNVPASVNQPFSGFPSDYTKLPRLAFVVPNVANDMHDGSVAQGDQWLRTHLDGYVRWAPQHNSLLIITWDEDDFTPLNRIPGVIVGAHVRPGQLAERVDHYTVLRTLQAIFEVPVIGHSADRLPITSIWTS